MSLNEIKTNDFDSKDRLDAITREKNSLVNVDTENELLKREFDILNYERRIKELEASLKELNLFNQNDSGYFNDQTKYLELLFSSFYKKREQTLNLLNIYKSRVELQKALINGKTKEINQKIGSIKNLKNNFSFVLTESYNNLYNINYEGIVAGKINIDVEAETATLPIAETRVVSPNKVYISAESNGSTGAFQTNENALPYYLIDGNDLSHFEYHKTDEGPLVCELVFEMSSEKVVNKFEIKRKSFDISSDINIKDIVYTDNIGNSRSIKELVDVNYQSLKVSSTDNDGKLIINHLPVKTKRVSVLIQQENYTLVNDRKVFSIAIESLFFYAQKFLSNGEYNLSNSYVPGGFFTSKALLRSFPKSKGHVSEITIYEKDNNPVKETFSSGETNSILLDGIEKNIKYNFKSRKNFNFNSSDEKLPLVKTSSREKQVNKSVEIDNIFVNDVYEEGKLFVYETTLRRSSSFSESIRLGTHSGNDSRGFAFPIAYEKYNIKNEELAVYVNGNILDSSEYSLDSIENKLNVSFESNIDKLLKRVKVRLKPKKPISFLKPEGIYIIVDEDFDIDQNNIKFTITKKGGLFSEILERRETEIFLTYQNVELLEAKSSRNGSKISLENFEVDNKLGKITVLNGLQESEIELKYKYATEETIENYFIWFEKEQAKGLFLPGESAKGKTFKQVLASDPEPENNFTLKHKNILLNTVKFDFGSYKEKTYIDGKSEFENIIKMDREKVPAIEADEDGLIEFQLSRTPIFTSPISIYNEKEDIFYTIVLQNDINALPENGTAYIFLDTNICILNIGAGNISSDIFLSYKYRGEQEMEPSFSVDAKKGIVYFSEYINKPNEKNVTYTVFDVNLEYSLVNKLNYEIGNKEVLFSTNNLSKNRGKVKAVWGYSENFLSFEDVEDYFSPIFYELTLGFN